MIKIFLYTILVFTIISCSSESNFGVLETADSFHIEAGNNAAKIDDDAKNIFKDDDEGGFKDGKPEEGGFKDGKPEDGGFVEGGDPPPFKMVKVCSARRTYGPYVPHQVSRKEISEEELKSDSKYLTFKRATRVTLAYQVDGEFIIPKQDPEKNHKTLSSEQGFKIEDLFIDKVDKSIFSQRRSVLYYSYHSDEEISKSGKKVFVASRLSRHRSVQRSPASGDNQSLAGVGLSGHSGIKFKETYGYEFLYNRRADDSEEAECDKLSSPLMINLNRSKGIKFTSQRRGMDFDIDGDGIKERISCPKRLRTPFLALPREGKVNSVQQLFGDNTYGPDGLKSDNGFHALAKYDLNKDAVIDRNDKVYYELMLWDEARNCNGKVDKGELTSLEAAGIHVIHLKYQDIRHRDRHGNEARQLSTVETDRGVKSIFDIWFASK